MAAHARGKVFPQGHRCTSKKRLQRTQLFKGKLFPFIWMAQGQKYIKKVMTKEDSNSHLSLCYMKGSSNDGKVLRSSAKRVFQGHEGHKESHTA